MSMVHRSCTPKHCRCWCHQPGAFTASTPGDAADRVEALILAVILLAGLVLVLSLVRAQ